MKKISCFVPGLEPWGIFTGALLAASKEKNLDRYKLSVEFYNLAAEELEKFLEIYSYSKTNVGKYFSR